MTRGNQFFTPHHLWLLGIAALLTFPTASRAEQFVLFDVTFTFTKEDADNSKPSKSHYYVKDKLINPDRPKDWTVPVDYRNGTVHIRTEVLEKPAGSEPTTWSLCYIPNKGQKNGYGCTGTTLYKEKGVYEQDVSMKTFWQNDSIVWTEGIKQMDLVMKDGSGGSGHAHKRTDHEKFFPTKVRITMIQVSAGAKYNPSLVPNLPAAKNAAADKPSKEGDKPADLVLLGGKIVTLDRQKRVVTAVAVRGGKIVATGSDAEVKPLIAQGKTEVIPLAGRMVLPGFIESHCHTVGVAKGTLEQTYVELGSIGAMQDWIREQATTLPAGTWIEVPRNEITRFKERRFPTPAELDAACTTHPVLYNSVSDKWVLNTRGFEELKLLTPESKIEGGEVLRDDAGKPLLIRGGTAFIRKQIPKRPEPSRDAVLAALTKVLKVYNEVGITSIYERATDPASLGLYRELREQGKLTTRVTGTFRFSAKTAEDVEKYAAGLGLKPGEGDEWIKAGPLKITIDGGIHWGTTRLSETYGPKRIAFYRLTNPEYRGEQFYSVDQMETIFGAANQLGWQMSCHVTGDEGTLRVLEALGRVAAKQPDVKQRRFTLIHAYFPSPEIIRQCRELGVCVDTQGYLYYKDADTLAEIYGPEWAERFIGLGDWVRGCVPVAVNADHMIGTDPNHAMNSFNPLLMMSIGVTRKTQNGNVHGRQQALSRLDALRTVTTWPAYLGFDEQKLGTLEVGKLADMVVLGGDYLKCPDAEIAGLSVERTIAGGLTVYQKEPRR